MFYTGIHALAMSESAQNLTCKIVIAGTVSIGACQFQLKLKAAKFVSYGCNEE